MDKEAIDILSVFVIIADIAIASFFIWRARAKKATLWGAARFIYVWIAALSIWHCLVYGLSLIMVSDMPIDRLLHPMVVLYMLNPLLVAIIHYRGGRIL
jgi:hypothetical protein